VAAGDPWTWHNNLHTWRGYYADYPVPTGWTMATWAQFVALTAEDPLTFQFESTGYKESLQRSPVGHYLANFSGAGAFMFKARPIFGIDLTGGETALDISLGRDPGYTDSTGRTLTKSGVQLLYLDPAKVPPWNPSPPTNPTYTQFVTWLPLAEREYPDWWYGAGPPATMPISGPVTGVQSFVRGLLNRSNIVPDNYTYFIAVEQSENAEPLWALDEYGQPDHYLPDADAYYYYQTGITVLPATNIDLVTLVNPGPATVRNGVRGVGQHSGMQA
jgi:hypothetical protein